MSEKQSIKSIIEEILADLNSIDPSKIKTDISREIDQWIKKLNSISNDTNSNITSN